MADPLDYFNPVPPDRRRPIQFGPRPKTAVPVEFDVLLTRTTDHGGARAVEVELERQGVPFFRTGSGELAGGVVELHVRSADHAFAAQLAAMVFARRKRLNQIDPRKPLPRSPWSNDDN